MNVIVRNTSPLLVIMGQRLWQGVAGLFTIVIVTHVMSAESQGWYYSFLSFAGLYTLFDLGLSLVLVQAAAHLSVEIRWLPDGCFVGGGSERLTALVAFAGRFYLRLCVGFICLVGPAGWIFFDAATSSPLVWQCPWFGLVLMTGLALLPLPLLAIVEGTGEIVSVAYVRLAQSALGAAGTWMVLLAGGGLWAACMTPMAAFFVTAGWIWLFRRGVLAGIRADHRLVEWRSEIWPLQWRLGFSWVSGYLLTQVQILVLFSSHDAASAGQMGLSLTIGNMIGLIAQAFLARHVPAMAKAVAQRQWSIMDRIFKVDLVMSSVVFAFGAAAAVFIVAMLAGTGYGARLLPTLPFSGLLFLLFLTHIYGAMAIQLRSYRREPLVWIAFIGAVATLVVGMFVVRVWGTTGLVATMAVVQLLFVLPCSFSIFKHRNRVWRQE